MHITRFIVILPICSNISLYWQFALIMKSGKIVLPAVRPGKALEFYSYFGPIFYSAIFHEQPTFIVRIYNRCC